jgi:hypothetical protein
MSMIIAGHDSAVQGECGYMDGCGLYGCEDGICLLNYDSKLVLVSYCFLACCHIRPECSIHFNL